MLFAINVPQSKSVSIAFISLKSMILGLIIAVTAEQVSDKSIHYKCVQSMTSFISLVKIFFILGIIIDVCSLLYFYLQKQFKKLEYYIFYFYHLIISFITIFGAINSGEAITGCYVSKSFSAAIIQSAAVLQISILIAMISNLFIVLKYLHFGSNIMWLVVWLTTLECLRIDVTLIAFIHAFLSLGNAVALFLYRWVGKTQFIVKLWKTLCIGSLFLMIFCYLIVLLGLSSSSSCQEDDFAIKIYIRYGLFQIVSPLLILIFLRNEAGDPRSERIKRHNQIFNKPEHDYVDFRAKI